MLRPTDLGYCKFNRYFDQQGYLNILPHKAAFLLSISGIVHLVIDVHVYFSVTSQPGAWAFGVGT